jgi:hypothetical protein
VRRSPDWRQFSCRGPRGLLHIPNKNIVCVSAGLL